jgi:hypothetical protein
MRDTSLSRRIGWIALILVGGMAFLWLIVFRLISRLGNRGPCPYAMAWMVGNPLRRRYMGQVLDHVGIRPGERVLELGWTPPKMNVE